MLFRDHTRLCRYVPLQTLFLYLSGKAFVPSVSRLRQAEPFETQVHYDYDHFTSPQEALRRTYGNDADGVLDWIYRSRLSELERELVGISSDGVPNHDNPLFVRHYLDFIRKTRYAWCWFAAEPSTAPVVESAAMWNIYGKDGALIVSTVAQVRSVLKDTKRDFEYDNVQYELVDGSGRVRVPAQNPDGTAFRRPYFFKRAEYASEREVRFVTLGRERETEGILIDLPQPNEWIDEILLWPGFAPSEEKALYETIKNFGYTRGCKRSGLRKNRTNEIKQESLEKAIESHAWQTEPNGIPAVLKTFWLKEQP